MKTNKYKTTLLTGAMVLLSSVSFSSTQYNQPEPPKTGTKLQAIVINGDTLPVVNLNMVTIQSDMVFKSRKQREQWDVTKFNVRKVYPYAILASAKLKEYEVALNKIQDEDDRDDYMKYAEDQLQKQFGDELKKLSMKQGKILIKLIDRQTGNTSYELVKTLRGKFSAFMWQGVARLFGSNLKSEYDANGDDKLIELAIRQIESGN
jgi:hypothetical protein